VLDAERLARRIHTAFDRPFEVDQLMLHVDSSLGVAVMPGHADSAQELMQRATWRCTAPSRPPRDVAVPAEHDGASADRLMLLGDLRNAIGSDQLQVYYQPTIDLATEAVVGFEALLRWTHPSAARSRRASSSPGRDHRDDPRHHSLRPRRGRQPDGRVDHRQTPFADLPVAVNLSARNLVEPTLAEFIEDLLGSFDLPPDRLILEVTETALIEDPMRTRRMLQELSNLGVTLAVDDFGTGYTSMAQLEQMPLHTLKIDRPS